MTIGVRDSAVVVVGILLLVMLTWAPLPLGSNRPWAWSLLGVWSGTLLFGLNLLHILSPRTSRWNPWVLSAGLLWLVVFVWVIVQQYPETQSSWHHPVWSLAADDGLQPVSRIAMNPADVAESSMRFLTLGATFWVAYLLGKDPRWASVIFRSIIAVTALYALFGLLTFFDAVEIELLAHPNNTPRFRSTFINPNNYATYANLGFLLILTLIAEPFVKASGSSWRRQFIDASQDLLAKRPWLLGAAVLLIGTSMLSASRGGAFSLLAAVLLLLFVLFLRTRPGRLRVASILVLALIIVAGLTALIGEGLLTRLAQLDEQFAFETGARLNAWSNSLLLIEQAPWTGHGLGSFQDAFTLIRDQRFEQIFDKAHNSYVELAVELGLPATFLVVLSFALLFITVFNGAIGRRRDMIYPLAAMAGTVLIATHALTEFSMQIPAVGVTYAAILGIGCAQAQGTRQARRDTATPAAG